jgi:hypothetical protein
MTEYRPLLKSLYPLGALVAVASVVEPLFRVLPFRLGEVGWRFGAVGFFSSAMSGVLFGVAVTAVIAALLGHRRVIRTLAVLLAAGSVVLLGVLVVFTLDYLQLRGTVNPQVQGAFDATVWRAMGMLVLVAGVAAGMAVGGWMSSVATSRRTAQARQQEAGMLIHAQPQGGGTA